MIIDYLELKNFLSHSDSRIEFSSGINVIVGPNGAGKSSLMDGIRFALHGITDRGDLSDLVMHGKNDLSARLGFRLNDRTYEIFRSVTLMKGGNIRSEAEIKADGMVEASGIKSVNSFVQKIMGINSDTFYSSIFVKQGEIDQLVSQRPADRKRLFSSIIGIDELERVSSVIKEMHTGIKFTQERYFIDSESLESKRNEYISLEEEKRKQIKSQHELEKRHDDLSSVIQKAMEEKEKLDQEFFEYQSSMKSVDQKRKESENFQRDIENLEREKGPSSDIRSKYESMLQNPLYTNREIIRQISLDLKNLDEKKAAMKELAKKLHRAKELKSDIEQLSPVHDEYIKISDEKEKIEEYITSRKTFAEEFRIQLKTLEREGGNLAKLEDEKKNIESTLPPEITGIDISKIPEIIESLNMEMQEIKRQTGENEGMIPLLESRIKEIEGKKGMLTGKNSCPVCGTPLTPEHLSVVIHDYDAEKSKYEKEKDERISTRDVLKKKMKDVAGKLNVLNSQSLKRYSRLASDISEKQVELQNLQGAIEKKRDLYGEYEAHEKSLLDLQKRLRDLTGKEEDFRARRSAYQEYEQQDLESDLKKLDSTITEMESRCRESMLEINMDQKAIESAPGRISEIERELKALQPKMDRITELEKHINDLSTKKSMLDSELVSLKQKADSLRDIPERRNDLQRNLDNLQKEERENLSELQRTRISVENIERNVDRLRSEIDLLKERLEKYNKIGKALEKLWNIKRSFDKDGIQSYIRRESSEAITEKTRRLASEFGLDIDDVKISEDFDVDVSVEGNVRSLSSLSGGEKTALAIALRLAVADYILNRISLFVLDEPTTFLDEDRRGQLKNILQNSLRDISIVPQLIVITHHQELTKAADSIFSIRKSNGVSVIEES